MTIGIIGLGMVGDAYYRYFKGLTAFQVIGYDKFKDSPHTAGDIALCDVVLICVPTPNGPVAQDSSAVVEALQLISPGQIAVIKSTVLPGTAEVLQKSFPSIRIVSSPEFLSEATADSDVKRPILTLIGLADDRNMSAATEVRSILPSPPESTFIMTSTEAELVKYAHNVSAYLNILTYNVLYDVGNRLGANWSSVKRALYTDPFLSSDYATPVDKGGRGAGGSCFIKDFEAFRRLAGNHPSADLLTSAVRYNWQLLQSTGKDIPILDANYPKS